MSEETAIEAEILRQAVLRGAEKSLCPSEVAQAMGPDWRSKLSAVRRAAIRLALAGRIDILRKGRKVEDPREVRGVIRLRIGPASVAAPDA
jgi:hypothetical protein